MAPRQLQCKPNEEAIQKALHMVRVDQSSIHNAARECGVPRSTLYDRVHGRMPYRQKVSDVLSAMEEARVVAWLEESAQRGWTRTKQEILNNVQAMLNDSNKQTLFKDNRPCAIWLQGFMQRHSHLNLLTSQTNLNLSFQKAASEEEKQLLWFAKAFDDFTTLGTDVLTHPERIFLCNEVGFKLKHGSDSVEVVPAKVLKKRSGSLEAQTTHKLISVLVCGNVCGDIHWPLLIFPGKSFSFNPMAGFPNAHFARSENGYIDEEIFIFWFKHAFIPAVDQLEKPVVLFIEKQKTYFSLNISILCRDHDIIMYQLPKETAPHPLDLSNIPQFTQAWSEEVITFQETMSEALGKQNFSKVFKKAWDRGIPKDIIVHGFKDAGIYPWKEVDIDINELTASYAQRKEETVDQLHLTQTDSISMQVSPSETSESVSEVESQDTAQETTRETVPESIIQEEDFETMDEASMGNDSNETKPSSCAHSSSDSHSETLPSHIKRSLPAPKNFSFLASLDRLLDIAAKSGLNNLVRYKTLHDMNIIQNDDPEEKLFHILYSKMRKLLHEEDFRSKENNANL